jgi:tetratricopeptide (TPR) repeat protein
MGYRLFVHGVMPKEGSEIDTEAGQIRLSIKNAAPGTCFAALGVLMIVAMAVQGNPEKKIEEVPTKGGSSRKVTWRSGGEDVSPAMARGRRLEQAGQLNEAILAYAEPLKNGDLPLDAATQPLRAIAAVYFKQHRLEEAIAYALLAYQVDPDDADGLALIARIQEGRGKHAEAVNYISQAARIDNAYIAERDRLKQRQ